MRSKRALGAIFLAVTLLPQGMGSSRPTAPNSGAFSLSALVRRGDPTPDGFKFFDCELCESSLRGLHSLSKRGEMVFFSAQVGPGAGVCGPAADFLLSGAITTRLIDFCHDTPLGKLGLVGLANLNDQGQVIMGAG